MGELDEARRRLADHHDAARSTQESHAAATASLQARTKQLLADFYAAVAQAGKPPDVELTHRTLRRRLVRTRKYMPPGLGRTPRRESIWGPDQLFMQNRWGIVWNLSQPNEDDYYLTPKGERVEATTRFREEGSWPWHYQYEERGFTTKPASASDFVTVWEPDLSFRTTGPDLPALMARYLF